MSFITSLEKKLQVFPINAKFEKALTDLWILCYSKYMVQDSTRKILVKKRIFIFLLPVTPSQNPHTTRFPGIVDVALETLQFIALTLIEDSPSLVCFEAKEKQLPRKELPWSLHFRNSSCAYSFPGEINLFI